MILGTGKIVPWKIAPLRKIAPYPNPNPNPNRGGICWVQSPGGQFYEGGYDGFVMFH